MCANCERVCVRNSTVEGLGVDAVDLPRHRPVPQDLQLLNLPHPQVNLQRIMIVFPFKVLSPFFEIHKYTEVRNYFVPGLTKSQSNFWG